MFFGDLPIFFFGYLYFAEHSAGQKSRRGTFFTHLGSSYGLNLRKNSFFFLLLFFFVSCCSCRSARASLPRRFLNCFFTFSQKLLFVFRDRSRKSIPQTAFLPGVFAPIPRTAWLVHSVHQLKALFSFSAPPSRRIPLPSPLSTFGVVTSCPGLLYHITLRHGVQAFPTSRHVSSRHIASSRHPPALPAFSCQNTRMDKKNIECSEGFIRSAASGEASGAAFRAGRATNASSAMGTNLGQEGGGALEIEG